MQLGGCVKYYGTFVHTNCIVCCMVWCLNGWYQPFKLVCEV